MGNETRIEQLGAPINPKDATTKKYVDDINTTTNNNVTALQTKTQNISATSTTNTITKTSRFRLSNSDIFIITDDSIAVRLLQFQNFKFKILI